VADCAQLTTRVKPDHVGLAVLAGMLRWRAHRRCLWTRALVACAYGARRHTATKQREWRSAEANKNERPCLSYPVRAASSTRAGGTGQKRERRCAVCADILHRKPRRGMDETAASSGAPGAAAGEPVEKKMPALKVVVAVDASDESLHALSWALDNVVRPHTDAALVVVHAQLDAEHLAYPLAAQGIRKCLYFGPYVRQCPALTLGIICAALLCTQGIGYVPPWVVESMRKAQEENSGKVVARALGICKAKQASRRLHARLSSTASVAASNLLNTGGRS
jgi:hypothetical protein